MNDILTAQLCTVCLIVKDLTAFRLRGRPSLKIRRVLHQVCSTCRKLQSNKLWTEKHPDKKQKHQKDYKYNLRREVMCFYAKGSPVCTCCGEAEYAFLTLDHVNGGGKKERKRLKDGYWRYLRENKPEGYQVLCMNCNWAKGSHGTCPHQMT